jgi:cell wall-associated NlpC family hydrolase
MSTIALTPKTGGGLCVPEQMLKPADIIVSTTPATISRVIRATTRSAISHAILYIGGDNVIEAIGEGVTRRPLDRALAEATLAVAYRHCKMTPQLAAQIVAKAKAWIGKKYDATGALGGGAANADLGVCLVTVGVVTCYAARKGMLNRLDRFYCSELVMEAYREAGAPIGSISPGISTPESLVQAYSSGVLSYVGHLKTQ